MTDAFEPIYHHLSAKNADLITLVLTSQGIKNKTVKTNGRYCVLVLPRDREKAELTLDLYVKENKLFRIRQKIEAFPVSSFKSFPAFTIMSLLSLIHIAVFQYHVHKKMVLSYGSSALYILQGETHRAITALFLHADTGHLLGNLAGMLIFAAPLISLTGFGTGPFLLLLTGTTGNLINAHFYKTAHLSIGASTAVMGAAGLLAAYQFMQKGKSIRMNHLMPVLAGTVLVSMFSQGENTDVWAHVFGFVSGLFYGIVFFPFNRILVFRHKEILFLTITLFIVVSAFLSGP